MEWVKCSDKLPQYNVNVLICTHEKYISSACYVNDCWTTPFQDFPLQEVTHWTELIKLPEDENASTRTK